MKTPIAVRELLYQRWQSLVFSLAVPGDEGEGVWLDLVARYEEDGRYYHNLTHIYHVLENIELMRGEVVDETAVYLAAWFHDVIYDPRRHDNERRSGEYGRQVLERWQLSVNLIHPVKLLILATENHKPYHPQHLDCLILLDADLAILGSDPELYQEYALAIRQEYSFVPEADYRKGRFKVLQAFINRPQIYYTDIMRTRLEVSARKNIKWELNRIG